MFLTLQLGNMDDQDGDDEEEEEEDDELKVHHDILDQDQVSFDENNGLQGGATFSLTHSLTHSHQYQVSLMRTMVCKEELAPHSHSDLPFIMYHLFFNLSLFIKTR